MTVMPVPLSLMLFRTVMKNGEALVTKPLLRPDLAQPWS